uniref:Nidogen 1 n=1 Tax=Pavo cristatus TaxID=9049 RepID=A0A8C9G8E6_PAVCR
LLGHKVSEINVQEVAVLAPYLVALALGILRLGELSACVAAALERKCLAVATNGIIAVNEPKNEEKYLGQFPVSFGAIAPFMADLDTTDGRGNVYYREDSSSDVLQLASDYIKGGFPETAFDPSSVVIVTWKLVAPYQGSGEDLTLEEKVNVNESSKKCWTHVQLMHNTVIYCFEGLNSFVSLAGVGLHGLKFYNGRISNSNLQFIENSKQCVFRYHTDVQQTCANNRHQCSVHAICTDYPNGFCCSCIAGYKGNGRQCVAEGSPQRVNGKVKGRIFVGNNPVPVTFENTDLHSYVVMNHGRAYTAISTIPEALGYSLLPLASIGGVIGWMFAVEQQGYKNGFSITGGEFTRQTEVTFLGNNEKLVIKQKFSGIDEHGHLTISTEMEGRVPEVPSGASVHIEPYTELYHTSSSVITSSSTREYTVTEPERDGVASTYTGAYQWRQTISFDECIHDDSLHAASATQQLSVDSIFVLYNRDEQILRYAMSNSIGPITVEYAVNHCQMGTHGCDIPQRAQCMYTGGSAYICTCLPGFSGDGRACEGENIYRRLIFYFTDIDECQQGHCHPDAFCYNTPGSFSCQCKAGYRGDGFQCDKVIIGVAYDCMDKMVYWTDISGPSISRASLHGGEPTTIIRTDLGSPEGIALDHLGRNIFWTDSQLDRIEVARLDGRQRRILFDTGLVNPRAIVVDPVRGNLYWTDWNREAPKIETSYMDGTNRRILVKDDLGLPNGLTFDPYSSMLCWVDAGKLLVSQVGSMAYFSLWLLYFKYTPKPVSICGSFALGRQRFLPDALSGAHMRHTKGLCNEKHGLLCRY